MVRLMLALFSLCLLTPAAFAGEADLKVPSLTQVQFDLLTLLLRLLHKVIHLLDQSVDLFNLAQRHRFALT